MTLSLSVLDHLGLNLILEEAGWRVIRFWTHEPAEAIARTIAHEVQPK
jgi:very-short-patch-repair endonuclease